MARTILSAINVCRCPSTFPIRSQLQEIPTCLTTTTSTSPHHDTHTSTTVVACGPYYGNTGGGRHRHIQGTRRSSVFGHPSHDHCKPHRYVRVYLASAQVHGVLPGAVQVARLPYQCSRLHIDSVRQGTCSNVGTCTGFHLCCSCRARSC